MPLGDRVCDLVFSYNAFRNHTCVISWDYWFYFCEGCEVGELCARRTLNIPLSLYNLYIKTPHTWGDINIDSKPNVLLMLSLSFIFLICQQISLKPNSRIITNSNHIGRGAILHPNQLYSEAIYHNLYTSRLAPIALFIIMQKDFAVVCIVVIRDEKTNIPLSI